MGCPVSRDAEMPCRFCGTVNTLCYWGPRPVDRRQALAYAGLMQVKARIAEKELFLKGEIAKAQATGKFEEIESLQKQLTSEIRRLQEDCETKKEKLRASFAK